MRIYDGIDFYAKEARDKIILQRGGETLTFGEFKKVSDDIGNYMMSNIPYKSKIIIKSQSPLKGLLILIGASKAGLKSILVDPSYPEEQIKRIQIEEDIRVIINEEEIFTEVKENSLKESIHSIEEAKENEIFLGILSSGSTGNPKVIWRNHTSWTNGFKNQSKVFGINKEDTFFIGGSLAYSANLNLVLHVINQGGKIVFASRKFPRSWLKDIKENKVTGIFLVPANYRIFLKSISQAVNDIRVLISAGEKMDIETLRKIKDCFKGSKFYEYYGASELGHVTYASLEELISKPQTVGRPFPEVNLKIIDGKIWVKSPCLSPEHEPWGSVKDLGYLDKDGFLFLEGREGRIINKGGIKIIPEDLEKIIASIPGIIEVAVLGIKDSLKGEVPVAFVERENEEINSKEIVAFIKGKVVNDAIPSRIIFVKKIPRNNFGKIHFKLLESMI